MAARLVVPALARTPTGGLGHRGGSADRARELRTGSATARRKLRPGAAGGRAAGLLLPLTLLLGLVRSLRLLRLLRALEAVALREAAGTGRRGGAGRTGLRTAEAARAAGTGDRAAAGQRSTRTEGALGLAAGALLLRGPSALRAGALGLTAGAAVAARQGRALAAGGNLAALRGGAHGGRAPGAGTEPCAWPPGPP